MVNDAPVRGSVIQSFFSIWTLPLTKKPSLKTTTASLTCAHDRPGQRPSSRHGSQNRAFIGSTPGRRGPGGSPGGTNFPGVRDGGVFLIVAEKRVHIKGQLLIN